MATNTEVDVKITVDGGQAVNETKKLRDNVEQLKNELRDLVEGTDEYEKKLKEVNDAQKKLDKSNDNVAKGLDKTAKGAKTAEGGFKSMGTALKSLGIITIIIEAFNIFKEALGRNQKVADTFSAVMTTITNVFSEFITIVTDVIDKVSKSSNGFDALGKVVKGLLTLAITPLKAAFGGIKLFIQQAQLAWEQSFFGDENPETIKRLNESIAETKEGLKETAVDAINAGKDIVTNFGDAVSQVGQVIGGVVEGASKISVKSIYEQAKATTALKNTAKIAEAQLQGLVEKYDRQAEQQRQIRDNENISIQERIEANNKLGAILQEQSRAQLALADKSIQAAQAELSANKGNVDLQAALIQAQNERAGILAQITGLESEQKVNAIALNKELLELEKLRAESTNQLAIEKRKASAELIKDDVERIEALKQIAKEEADIELKRLQGVIDSTVAGTQARLDAEIEFNTKKQELEIQADEFDVQLEEARRQKRQQRLDAEKKASDERIAAAAAEAKAKEEIETAYLNTFSAGINLLKSLGEKNKGVQKIALIAENAVTIAKIILDTQKQIASAATAASLVPPFIPPGIINPAFFVAKAFATKQIAFAKVNAGIGIATSLAATAKGLSQLGGGSAGGGSSVGGGASAPAANFPSAPLVPQAETTLLNQGQVNQIGNVAARAYVVESDVSGNQQRIQRLERAARIA